MSLSTRDLKEVTLRQRFAIRVMRANLTSALVEYPHRRDRLHYRLRRLEGSTLPLPVGLDQMESPVEYYRRSAPLEVTDAIVWKGSFRYEDLYGRSNVVRECIPDGPLLYVFWVTHTPLYVGMTRAGTRRIFYSDHPVRMAINANPNLELESRVQVHWYRSLFPDLLGKVEYAVEHALKPAWNNRHDGRKSRRKHKLFYENEESGRSFWIDWGWRLPSWRETWQRELADRELTLEDLLAI